MNNKKYKHDYINNTFDNNTIVSQMNATVNNQNIKSKSSENNTDDEIAMFLSKIQNKYSDNTDQKHLNQMYDIGILVANRDFNREKLIKKLTKIIDERTREHIKKVRVVKRTQLVEAFKKGIEDGMSDEYRLAYDNSNAYQYNSEKLQKRAHIDSVLDNFGKINVF